MTVSSYQQETRLQASSESSLAPSVSFSFSRHYMNPDPLSYPSVSAVQKLLINIKVVLFCHNENLPSPCNSTESQRNRWHNDCSFRSTGRGGKPSRPPSRQYIPDDTPSIKPSIPVDRSHFIGSYPSLRRNFVQCRKASRSNHPTSAKKRAGSGSCYRRRAGKIFRKRSPASHHAISCSSGSRTR